MTQWSYTSAPDKTTRFIYPLAAAYHPQLTVLQTGPWTGIDSFINVCLHENRHVLQISSADAVLTMTPGTCWQYGWSWNLDPSLSNHWALGFDLAPGYQTVDDDSDGLVDNQITTGRGEVGYGNDEPLDDDYISPIYEWPDSWGTPPSPQWEDDNPIEHEAFADQTVAEHAYWTSDWGLPGKQHATNQNYNN